MGRERLLLIGSSGNVGRASARHLAGGSFEVWGTHRGGPALRAGPSLELDLETGVGLEETREFEAVFLLRPPQLADMRGLFRPWLERLATGRLRKLVLLSVLGADRKGYLPHAKLERALRELGLPHVVLRPAYFMENLVTTLGQQLEQGVIRMPSGDHRFPWVALDDVGRAVAAAFERFDEVSGRAFPLAHPERLSLGQACEVLNRVLGTRLRHESPGLLRFVRERRRPGDPWGYVGVLLLLHWLPRFERPLELGAGLQELTGREPMDLASWAETQRANLLARTGPAPGV